MRILVAPECVGATRMCADTVNCSQNVFQLRRFLSEVGKSNFGSLTPLSPLELGVRGGCRRGCRKRLTQVPSMETSESMEIIKRGSSYNSRQATLRGLRNSSHQGTGKWNACMPLKWACMQQSLNPAHLRTLHAKR